MCHRKDLKRARMQRMHFIGEEINKYYTKLLNQLVCFLYDKLSSNIL